MNDAKFIVVKDKDIANQLIINGFNLISNVCDTYTFMNIIPKHFNFENIDIKKLVYTNMLTF